MAIWTIFVVTSLIADIHINRLIEPLLNVTLDRIYFDESPYHTTYIAYTNTYITKEIPALYIKNDMSIYISDVKFKNSKNLEYVQ